MAATEMTCTYCGKTKAYPDGFPNRAYAECWECAWWSHMRKEHPKVIRQIKREVEKRAKRLVSADLWRAASERERLALALPKPPEGGEGR